MNDSWTTEFLERKTLHLQSPDRAFGCSFLGAGRVMMMIPDRELVVVECLLGGLKVGDFRQVDQIHRPRQVGHHQRRPKPLDPYLFSQKRSFS